MKCQKNYGVLFTEKKAQDIVSGILFSYAKNVCSFECAILNLIIWVGTVESLLLHPNFKLSFLFFMKSTVDMEIWYSASQNDTNCYLANCFSTAHHHLSLTFMCRVE